MGHIQPDIHAIFNDALELDSDAERRAYLDQACGHDAQIRSRVEELLRADAEVGNFLGGPFAAGETTQVDRVGTQIGPYRIREQIGEGGMGIVYVAEQTHPVRRKVGLKIIRPGMSSKDIIGRFEAERQALAMMDHPNIAHIFDAGATETGQPYFVMELVQGPSITEYCDQHQLSNRQRLELFVQVCGAVQHAHQKGIIHRDIKPSNVLVPRIDGVPVPKVIDFGVAKAVRDKLSDKTAYTHFRQIVGTPLYMSPEQADLGVVDIDTRSDVYSLGVVLYELLTGVTPFDRDTSKRVGFDEMRRIIREVDPPRPSHRVTTLEVSALSTTSARRGVDGRRLSRTLQGELDWIVMKALDKDRTRRYESPGALAADVQRYLGNQPVEASPPSGWYVLKKLVIRHKPYVAAIAAVMAALLLGAIATSWQALVATRAKNLAHAAEAEAITARENTAAAQQRATRHLQSALAAVDQMLSHVGDQELKNIPLMEATRSKLLEDAVQLYDRLLQDAPHDAQLQMDTAITLRRKAELLYELGRLDDARQPVERSVQMLRARSADEPDNERVRLELARSLFQVAAISNQLPPLEEAVTLLRGIGPELENHRNAVIELPYAISLIGAKVGTQGDRQQAREAFAEAERLFEVLIGRNEPDHDLLRSYAKHLINFADFLQDYGDWPLVQKRLDKAVELGRTLVAQQREAADLHIYATALMNRGTARFRCARASVLNGMDQAVKAEDLALTDRDLQQSGALFGELMKDYPAVPVYRERLAGTLTNRLLLKPGPELEMELAEKALEILRQLADDYPSVHQYRRSYAGALSNTANLVLFNDGSLERAEQLSWQAIEQQQRFLAANSEDLTGNQFLANHYVILAEVLTRRGQLVQAIDACEQGLRVAQRLRQLYPENAFVSLVIRRFEEMKQEAEAKLGTQTDINGDSHHESE